MEICPSAFDAESSTLALAPAGHVTPGSTAPAGHVTRGPTATGASYATTGASSAVDMAGYATGGQAFGGEVQRANPRSTADERAASKPKGHRHGQGHRPVFQGTTTSGRNKRCVHLIFFFGDGSDVFRDENDLMSPPDSFLSVFSRFPITFDHLKRISDVRDGCITDSWTDGRTDGRTKLHIDASIYLFFFR